MKRQHFFYYLNEYELEFLQKACEYKGQEPTEANVIRLAHNLAREGINEEVKRVFRLFKAEREQQEREGGQHGYAKANDAETK